MNIIEFFANRKTREKEQDFTIIPNNTILNEIDDVKFKLNSVQDRFKMAVDEDLIDSLIYEEIALISRYEYLIKESKKLNICVDFMKIMK